MSYNPYQTPNHYPPYYQANQTGRSDLSGQSRNGNPYQQNYQPLSAYQTYPGQHSTTPHLSNLGDASREQYGRPKVSNGGYANSRTSVDSSALGDLAHASSLGRDNSNPHQTFNPNLSEYRNLNSYGITSQESNSHGRIDGTPKAISRDGQNAQPATSSPSFGHSSNTGNIGYRGQNPNIGGGAQGLSMGSQQPRPSAQHYQTNQYNNHPPGPPSGQAVQHHSRKPYQGLQSPTVPVSQVKARNAVGPYRTDENSKQSTPQELPHQQPSLNGSRTGSHTPSSNSRTAAVASAPNTVVTGSSHTNSYVPSTLNSHAQPVNTNNKSNTSSSQSSTPTSNFATTVDPSHVFNDVEYQRRQAAEAVKKKAEDARLAAQAKELTSTNTSIANQSGQAPHRGNNNVKVDKKNQIELEMKTMIEKMREYKSKDPTLFSQIWEQVKKGQPSQRTPSQSAQGLATSPAVVDGRTASPGLAPVQLPPESELPAAESLPPGFDRGRFPAQRRRRGGSSSTPTKKPATPKGATGQVNPRDQETMKVYVKGVASPTPPTIPAIAQMIDQNPPSHPPTHSGPSSTATTATTSAASAPPIQPPQAARPLPPEAGRTYWPEDKKRALAEAARVGLTSMPSNAGKAITTNEIHELLDQNPSYTQMCEILEYRGFVIDRSQFARLLLSAVPDLGSAKAPAPPTPKPLSYIPPVPLPPHQHPHTNAPNMRNNYVMPYPTPNPLGQPSNVWHGQAMTMQPGHQHIHPSAPPPLGPTKTAPTASTPKASVKWADENSRPGVVEQYATKQAMARKRSFGEIVDLTQCLSDDDDDTEPPRQQPRIEVENGPPTSLPSIEEPKQRIYEPFPKVSDGRGTATPTSGHASASLDGLRYNPTAATAGKYIYSGNIVKRIDKLDALRRSSYNPKTIARDILLAIGRHPTMASLNSHLENLREQFKAVNHDSDLSTFRWDLVDPGGPPVQTAPEGDEKDEGSATRPISKRPHVAVIVGRSGDEKAATSVLSQCHRKGFKPTRGGHTSFSNRTGPDSATPSSNQHQSPNQDPGSGLSRFVYNNLSTSRTPVTNSKTNTPANSSGPKRVGRPPGAKNRNPRPEKEIHKKSRNSLAQIDTPLISKADIQQHGTLISQQETPLQSPISTIPTRPRIDTTPAKPNGLKNAMSPTDGIAVVIPSRSPSVREVSQVNSEHSATRFKPANTVEPSDRYSPTSPSFKVFKCQWDKCPAELHSLATLKKHLRKHRNPQSFENGPVPCLWENCSSGNVTMPHIPDVNDSSACERLTFESEEAWDTHVENAHLNPNAKEIDDFHSSTPTPTPKSLSARPMVVVPD